MILAVDNVDFIIVDILIIIRRKNLCLALNTIQPLILKSGLLFNLLFL